MTDKPIDRDGVGAWIGLPGSTIRIYQRRYAKTHPFPKPDGTIGGSPYWMPDRKAEIKEWAKNRPGQGVGGGRPRKRPEPR